MLNANKHMKLSKWNSYIDIDEHSGLIYNAFTDKFIVVRCDSMDLVYAKRGEIRNFSPLFTDQMLCLGGLIDESLDETQEIDRLIYSKDLDKSLLNIIINPTLDCNFKCWYCYEKHIENSCMSEKVKNSLIALIDERLCKNKETTECQLSFFGGEPFLRFNEVVRPLISKAAQICDKNDVSLSLQFTTNGFLINDDVIDFLRQFTTSLQITLDGGKNEHDKTRFAKGGIPSYDIIIKNIIKLANVGLHVILRINYTHKNIESCRDIITDLDKITYELRNSIVVDFQRVWQDRPVSYEDTTDLVAQELRKELQSKKYRTSNNRMIDALRSPCYADNINELLVNYNGDIFFCTARDFNSDNRAGTLKEDGKIAWIGNSYSKRMSCKFRKPVCRECRIAPICGGGCRTKCLETNSHDKCNFGYSEEDIDNLILDRFIFRYM